MKKLILGVVLLFSVATYSQKDELKTLKKIYAKETITAKDLEAYKAASDALSKIATEKSDVVYAKFYKVMYPTVVLASKGQKATPQDKMAMYNPTFIKEYGTTIDETIAFEKESGKKIYTEELIQEKNQFKQSLNTAAFEYNKNNKLKEASGMFYTLYLFDPANEGQALENAAILAVQAKDYLAGEKLYSELYNSDYMNNGKLYYAVNIATGEEELMPNRETMVKYIGLKTHEKPRTLKVSDKKPETIKTLALLAVFNKNLEAAKKYYAEAEKLAPNDKEVKDGQFTLYFNEGYDMLKDDQKIVDEINANRDNKEKYDVLMNERKAMFKKALPSFEKAYQLKSDDANTKALLKMAYEILDMKEKAAMIK